MNATFDPRRSEAVRVMLVEAATPKPARRRLWAVALVIAGAVGGAALSTAALAATGQLSSPIGTPSGEPTPTLPNAIDAPPGVIPGASVAVLLGNSTSLSISQRTTFSLADRPEGTTHARVLVTPETAGSIAWGTDPSGNNPTGTWGPGDIGPRDATWYDFPLDSSTNTLYFVPSEGFTGMASVQFITLVPTRLGVNASGETFGVDSGPAGSPDLTAVEATAPDGSQVQAYARTTDLNAFSPEHHGQPANPTQAIEWQDERAKLHPNGWDIPAYESDGETKVGSFHVG